MKKTSSFFAGMATALLLIAVIYTDSTPFVKSRKISFIPDDVTQFLYLGSTE